MEKAEQKPRLRRNSGIASTRNRLESLSKSRKCTYASIDMIALHVREEEVVGRDCFSTENLEINVHERSESLMLWLLALTGLVVGKMPTFGLAFCLIFATAYTMPLTNPIMMADTLGKVTGASKKINPESAIGSLFSAPTME